MQLRNWSGYGLKAATWQYKSARYCAFHAALLHFVDRSLVGEKRPAGYRKISSPHWRSSQCVQVRHLEPWASESLRSLWSVYLCTLNHNSDNEHFWYRRWGSANCTGLTDWLLGLHVWCGKQETQNRHPTARLCSMITTLPMFDTSAASVKKTETRRALIS